MTATFFLAALLSITAHAHHGLDFMVLQDGTLPKPGSMMLFDNSEWSTFDGAEEWSTEPGLHLGFTPWLAIGTTASIMDEGNGWHYLSTTPYLNIPIFKSDRVPWLKVSFYAGYELPDNAARTSSPARPKTTSSTGATRRNATLKSQARSKSPSPPPIPGPTPAKAQRPNDSRRRPAAHLTGGGTVGGGGPDAPGTGSGTIHDHPISSGPREGTTSPTTIGPAVNLAPIEQPFLGIHRHGEEGLHARLIIDMTLGDHDKLLANVINFTPADGTPVWGYGIGFRHAFNHDLAASLEAIGDFDGRGSHEVLIALHRTFNHALTLKIGAGAGITATSPDASIHAGIVWRF